MIRYYKNNHSDKQIVENNRPNMLNELNHTVTGRPAGGPWTTLIDIAIRNLTPQTITQDLSVST